MAESPLIKIAPSILSADFGQLAHDVARVSAAGADYIHVDVMDGRFVPNITLGPVITAATHRATTVPLDVHLMIVEPEKYVAAFAEAGASSITVHLEACPHLHRVVGMIHEHGCRAGVAINPATPVSLVTDILSDLDLLLVMTVNPGFGGQSFIRQGLTKVSQARAMIDNAGLSTELEVDGGVSPDTIGALYQAGARVFVAGTAIFGHTGGVETAIQRLRAAVTA